MSDPRVLTSPDHVTVPLPVPADVAGAGGPGLPRRRAARIGEQNRRIPWLWVAGALVLLLLVGRGLVGAVLGRGAGTPSAGGASSPVPTVVVGLAGGADASSTVGPADSVTAVPTVGPTPPPTSGRVTLALASPSATGVTSPGTVPPSGLTPSPTAPSPTTPSRPSAGGGAIVGVQSGKCVDVAGGSAVDLARIDLSTCDGGAAQAIRYTTARELRVLGKCLDAMNQQTSSGTPIILYTCTGQPNQKWTFAGGTIRGVQSGLCLDATAQGIADGTPLELWACNGGTNQAWTR